MISTTVMIKRGKVYGNLMVDVQIKNTKLRKRAINIIKTICGLSEEEAEEYLERAKENTKIAIIMAKIGLDYKTSKIYLEKNKGNIKRTLKEFNL